MKSIIAILRCAVLFFVTVSAPQMYASTMEENTSFPGNYAKAPRFAALIYYADKAEPAHVVFARQAIDFFTDLTVGDGFILQTTTSLSGFTAEDLGKFDVIIDINAMPATPEERRAFETYMENGGGWMGFHAAGYNDSRTGWKWFNDFLGAGTFLCNNWPPQPVLLEVNNGEHPVTRNLPGSFVAPKCEWYMWNEPPELRANVDVLLSVSPLNYPLGLKDVVSFGNFPVVWTNRDYRMIYLNIGHGDAGFSDATQNLLIINALRWIVSRSPGGDPFKVK